MCYLLFKVEVKGESRVYTSPVLNQYSDCGGTLPDFKHYMMSVHPCLLVEIAFFSIFNKTQEVSSESEGNMQLRIRRRMNGHHTEIIFISKLNTWSVLVSTTVVL